MGSDAKNYNALNKPQYDFGRDLVRMLNISEGYKVLDMGCGTGDVANLIASLVGPHGEVVGVDPDEERIKIAREKFKDVPNLSFVVGDSSSKLPHDEEEEYYDLHFSSSVIHWLIGDEKKVYMEKAYKCLKEDGCLAFFTAITGEHCLLLGEVLRLETFSEAEYKKLCEDHCFGDVMVKYLPVSTVQMTNFEVYQKWFQASYHCDFSKCDPVWRKRYMEKSLEIKADGSVEVKYDGFIHVIAKKL